MPKEIDYLVEDPPVSGQRFALVSIVGPNMNQKCDVWGLKIRGTVDSVDKAKTMTKKLLKIDPDYDIYTVEVGKFFPLNVEPHDIQDIEYQNEALNKLVKGYLENKELANEHWHERKRDLVQKAISEGKNQEVINAKPEHPVAVLQRVKNFEKSIEELKEQLQHYETDLIMSKTKFENVYTNDEKELAFKELESEIKNVLQEVQSDMTIEQIRKELSELTVSNEVSEELSKIEQLQKLEREMEINPSQTLQQQFEDIKKTLTVQERNDYINTKFTKSPYNNM